MPLAPPVTICFDFPETLYLPCKTGFSPRFIRGGRARLLQDNGAAWSRRRAGGRVVFRAMMPFTMQPGAQIMLLRTVKFCSTNRILIRCAKLPERYHEPVDDERAQALRSVSSSRSDPGLRSSAREIASIVLPAGELSTPLRRALKTREQFVNCFHCPTPALPGSSREPQMLINVKRGKNAAALRNVANAKSRDLERTAARQIHTFEIDTSACCGRKPHNSLAQRCFTHAIAADNGKRFCSEN